MPLTGFVVWLALFLVFGILRVNLFLDVIRDRSDWQNLVGDFGRSGFHSLRAYANYVYAQGILVFPIVGVVGGALSSAIGGVFGSLLRRQVV